MKLRTIFIIFNIIIILSFFFIFFLPFFLLGSEYSLAFWKSNWYLAVLFLALIAALNAFFLSNRRVISLVEREDWSSLSACLVERMLVKGQYRNSYIRLLVNAYLLQSDVAGIDRLEAELAAKRPQLLQRNALLFGMTRLLRGEPAKAELFMKPYIESGGVENRDWLRFDYAFSLALQRRHEQAAAIFREGCASRDAVLALLSAYLLQKFCGESAALADQTRLRLAKRFSPARWSKEVGRAKNEVHIVVLSKLVDEAGGWLFDQSGERASG